MAEHFHVLSTSEVRGRPGKKALIMFYLSSKEWISHSLGRFPFISFSVDLDFNGDIPGDRELVQLFIR